MTGNPRMNNFKNNMSTSELNTQTWAECDVMSTNDLISMLLERKGDFFHLMGIWYLMSICWKSYCEAYLFRHAFNKNYFCLGAFGVGFYLNKDGRGLGSKFQTDFLNVLTDSFYLLENVNKCILIYFKWTAASLKNSDANYKRRLLILWTPNTWGNRVAWP